MTRVTALAAGRSDAEVEQAEAGAAARIEAANAPVEQAEADAQARIEAAEREAAGRIAASQAQRAPVPGPARHDELVEKGRAVTTS